MCQQPMYRLLVTSFVAVAVLTATAQASLVRLDPNNSQDSVTLAELTTGQIMGVAVGDKTFTDFFYSTLPGDDMPAPEDINVFGFKDLDGNYGVSFHGAFIDLPGGGPSDALLRFTVNVDDDAAARGYRISDAHLFIGGVGVGDDSVFTVDETFQNSNQALNTFASTLNGNLDTQLSDWIDFEELKTQVRVTKDIFALAGDTNLPARATVIDQSFSQEIIPEPATLGLLSIALMGIVASRRKV